MPRLGGGGLGLWMALLLGAPGLVAAAPLVTGGSPRPGLRVDLAGTAQHVRALERQPDGTYRSVCTDNPEALRPATRTGVRR